MGPAGCLTPAPPSGEMWPCTGKKCSGPDDPEAALIRDRLEGLQHCLCRIDSGEAADSAYKRYDARLIGPVFAWATIMCGNYGAIYE